MNKMIKGIIKAAKLEFIQFKGSKINLLLMFLIPPAIIVLFSVVGSSNVSWSENVDYNTHCDFFASAILPIVIIFITMQLTILRIVAERSPLGTLDRDLLAISRPSMFLGKLFANVLIALIQCLLIYLIGIKYLKIYVAGPEIGVLIILILTSVIGTSLGLTFSVFSKSKEQAVQLVPLTILIFLVLSGIFIKVEEMPSTINSIASNLPLTLSYQSLWNIMLMGQEILDVQIESLKLTVWFILITFVGLAKFTTE